MRSETWPDRARFFQIAMGSASEVECHLLLARDLRLLAPVPYAKLHEATVEVERMLAAHLRKMRHPGLTRFC